MKNIVLLLASSLLLLAACNTYVVDTHPPASPAAVRTISLDNAVEIQWAANTESDLAGYNVWVSDRFDGRYTQIGTTSEPLFVDYGAVNGLTYYYGITAYDFEGNESEMSRDVVYDTPRPEGYSIRLYDYHTFPSTAGYDFSTYSIGQYDDNFTDFFFENYSGRFYLNVWDDTDVQDMGYTETLDDISVAPEYGWSPSGYAEAIEGHTYVVWTWDDHYAKVRITKVTATSMEFDWAYQTAPANPELKRSSKDGGRILLKKLAAKRQ